METKIFLVMVLVIQLFCVIAGRELQQKASDAESRSSMLSNQPLFFPAECQNLCITDSDHHAQLLSTSTTVVGNAATQLATSLLIQIQKAVLAGTTSPPLVARMLAVYSTAVYDAVAVLKPGMRPVHATHGCRQPGASAHKAGVEAAITGAAHTVIQALFPTADITSISLSTPHHSKSQQAAYATGMAAAQQVLAARANDGFANPPPQLQFPNPPMDSTAVTNCPATDIQFWQQLRVPAVKAFTPSVGAEFPPASYSSVTGSQVRVQPFLASAAAFAKPFSHATLDLVSTLLKGPNLLTGPNAQPTQFRTEMDQVLAFSASLDDVSKTISELWANGPDSTFPPGHWYRIALEESEVRELSLKKTVVLLLAVGNALQDAGIAAWRAKATRFSARPITALQCLYSNQLVTAWRGPYLGIGPRNGSTWQPYQPTTFITPPFPGYVSGHSTFSAAASRVLTRFFGKHGDRDAKFKGAKCYRTEAGSSLIEPRIDAGTAGHVAGFTDVPSQNGGQGYSPGRPVVLCHDTFQEAALQAGVSRQYGGIHVAKDDTDGQLLGDMVGNTVANLVNEYAPGNL